MVHFKKLFFILFLAYSGSVFSQIVIKELPAENASAKINSFLGESLSRKIIDINNNWIVYPSKKKSKNTKIVIPASFDGEKSLVFERSFDISREQKLNKRLQLIFLGLSYSAEVTLNKYVIYKHPGGEFPFKIDLPPNLLLANKSNLLQIKVTHDLEAENTIPANPRFLFPESFGGIIRGIYIKEIPAVEFSSLNYSYAKSGENILFNIDAKLSNFTEPEKDTLISESSFIYKIQLISPTGDNSISDESKNFELSSGKEKTISGSYTLRNPSFWSPENPNSYLLNIQLFKGDQLIDEVRNFIAMYSFDSYKTGLKLNGNEFNLTGTTYLTSYQNFGNMISYQRMEEDIKVIKDLGFNTVRFAKHAPHPYLLELCREYGLLAFIELPINSLPEFTAGKENYVDRVKSYLGQFLNNYSQFSAVAAIGLGSSYLPNSETHTKLISGLAKDIQENSPKLVYASFSGFNLSEIKNLDLYGVEFYNKQITDYENRYNELQTKLGKGKVFISEATYPAYYGGTDGYLNSFSLEAQAKYYSDLIDFAELNNISGYFINSIFNYRGDFASITSGYSSNNIYKIGILDETRQVTGISQKVIHSKLNDGEKVTIPIGSKTDNMPLVFVVAVIVIVMILGLLVNSKRKFREDATRALLRPYNFFADIRDHRMFSFFQANILMIILSLCSALLLINLLFFLRTNVLFEKVLLSFGSENLMKSVSYLSWNPNEGIIWLFGISLTIFIFLTIIIKIASLFVKNKVFYSSIYYMFVWAFLPLILLLPLGLMLYKILSAETISLYLLIALLIFNFWIYVRLVKGIYVIFDVNPGPVYFYSLAIIFFMVSGVLIYFQLTNSTIFYVINAYKQYLVM